PLRLSFPAGGPRRAPVRAHRRDRRRARGGEDRRAAAPGVLADAPRRARPSFGLPEGRWPQDRRLVRDAERRRGPVRRRGRGLLQHQHARRAEQLGKRDPMTVKSPLVLLTTLFLVAALGAPQPAAAQTGPIRVGFLTVRTGPLAAGGKQMEE